MHVFKRLLVVILIIGILVPHLFLVSPVHQTEASGFGPTPTYELPFGTNAIKEWLLDFLARILAEVFIRRLGDQVVSWIQGGDANFIQNIEQDLLGIADEEAGRFLNELVSPGVNLCGNISAYLDITLRLGIAKPGRRLSQTYSCSLSAIIGNVQNIYENFSSGGWQGFVRANIELQNTAYGAYFIALDEKNSLETRKREARSKDLQLGSGFLGVSQTKKFCDLGEFGTQEVADQAECQSFGGSYRPQTNTVTPGRAVADSLSKTLGTDYDFAVVADEINEILVSIVSALINRVIGSGGVFDFDSGGSNLQRGDPQFTPIDSEDDRLPNSAVCGPTPNEHGEDTASVGDPVVWRVEFRTTPDRWGWIFEPPADSITPNASSTYSVTTTYSTAGRKTAEIERCNDQFDKFGNFIGENCFTDICDRPIDIGSGGAAGPPPSPSGPLPPPAGIDVTPPTVSIVFPAAGDSFPRGGTNILTVDADADDIAGAPTETPSGMNRVEFTINGVPAGVKAIPVVGTVYTSDPFDLLTVPDGTSFDITVQAFDNDGLSSTDTITVSIP